jgi:hypothetical protein
MTFLALFLLDDGVDAFLPQVFIGEGLVAVQALLLLHFPLSLRRTGRGHKSRCAQEKGGSKKKHFLF